MILLKFSSKRVIRYTSYTNYKLFKRYLIMKFLLNSKSSNKQTNFYMKLLGLKKGNKINEIPLKIFYSRKEFIPFRLLRFMYIFYL